MLMQLVGDIDGDHPEFRLVGAGDTKKGRTVEVSLELLERYAMIKHLWESIQEEIALLPSITEA